MTGCGLGDMYSTVRVTGMCFHSDSTAPSPDVEMPTFVQNERIGVRPRSIGKAFKYDVQALHVG